MIGYNVVIGNNNGRSIPKSLQNVFLYTQDLTPCIAVCIESPKFYYMIHSNTNYGFFNSLALLLQKTEPQIMTACEIIKIHLLGGNTAQSIEEKQQSILKVFPPHLMINWGRINIDVSYAYFGQEIISTNKYEFATRLGRDPSAIKINV